MGKRKRKTRTGPMYSCESDFNCGYWVKKYGVVHKSSGLVKYCTDCGLPMLGNNYADCAVNRKYCAVCFPELQGE